jgi:hypothetical protein
VRLNVQHLREAARGPVTEAMLFADRGALCLDYWPALRGICESEALRRQTTTTRRARTFYHHLERNKVRGGEAHLLVMADGPGRNVVQRSPDIARITLQRPSRPCFCLACRTPAHADAEFEL